MRTHVAVGIIYNSKGTEVLITRRTNKQHLAGYWEFPGGKVESGENVQTALGRELEEELGIVVNNVEPFMTIKHDYPDKKVLLDVWKVYDWEGEPEGREDQEIVWTKLDSLESHKFPEANKIIVQSMPLNPVCVISQPLYEDYSRLYSIAEECFSAGLKLFQLRLKSENKEKLKQIVDRLSIMAAQYNAKIVLNGSADDINDFNVDGIHLNSSELFKYNRRPIGEKYLLGASCHNEKELIHASKINVNYAFISPVNATNSHPDQAAIGWTVFKCLTEKVNIPVYALGGMTSNDLRVARSNGAFGIATLGAIWDSGSVTKSIESFKQSMFI